MEEIRKLKMTFDIKTINHLGVKLYSTLPPVMSEVVSNAYDADAEELNIFLYDKKDKKIIIQDDGIGMSYDEIIDNFLIIGRNRREEVTEITDKNRKVIGKKGIGKLAVFGIASKLTVSTSKDGLKNTFIIDYNSLINGNENAEENSNDYFPEIIDYNIPTQDKGTTLTLENINRKSKFDTESLVRNLSRIFNIYDDDFKVCLYKNDVFIKTMNCRDRYSLLNEQFVWKFPEDFVNTPFWKELSCYTFRDEVKGNIITTLHPLKKGEGETGFVLFARKKIVQRETFFNQRANDLFHTYMTGDFEIDFIDEKGMPELISTDRASLIWETSEAQIIQEFFVKILKRVGYWWRVKRKEEQEKLFSNKMNDRFRRDKFETLPKSFRNGVYAFVDIFNQQDKRISEIENEILDVITTDTSEKYLKSYERQVKEISNNNETEIFRLLEDWKLEEVYRIKQIASGRKNLINKFESVILDKNASNSVIKLFTSNLLWLLTDKLFVNENNTDIIYKLEVEINDYMEFIDIITLREQSHIKVYIVTKKNIEITKLLLNNLSNTINNFQTAEDNFFEFTIVTINHRIDNFSKNLLGSLADANIIKLIELEDLFAELKDYYEVIMNK